jgi:hypothetical protein
MPAPVRDSLRELDISVFGVLEYPLRLVKVFHNIVVVAVIDCSGAQEEAVLIPL